MRSKCGGSELRVQVVLTRSRSTLELDLPVPSVSDGLVVHDGLVAGEKVRVLSIHDFQVISAAPLHLVGLVLKQNLAAQLVKHDGVHLWPDRPRVAQKGKEPRGCVTGRKCLPCEGHARI